MFHGRYNYNILDIKIKHGKFVWVKKGLRLKKNFCQRVWSIPRTETIDLSDHFYFAFVVLSWSGTRIKQKEIK